jgi:hypothetical protein
MQAEVQQEYGDSHHEISLEAASNRVIQCTHAKSVNLRGQVDHWQSGTIHAVACTTAWIIFHERNFVFDPEIPCKT